jgi:hypothetical protein
MSPRSIRRAAERKAQKMQRKQERLAATNDSPVAIPSREDEFSPELIAEARAVRERVAARVEINRANAAHSSGPVTPAGKLASSRNSLKHGLASGTLIIPGEDQAAFEALLQNLLEDHQPASSTEEMLVHEMAQSWWLTQRALRLQNDCFTGSGIDEKRLALFLRYQTTHERAFHKALNTLIRLQKDRRKTRNGFVSQQRDSSDQEIGFVSQNEGHMPAQGHFLRQNPPVPELISTRQTAEAA